MPRTTNLVPIALVFAACASQHIQMRIPQEITTRTSATITVDSGASGVALHYDENATVLEKDGYTVFFPGHRGRARGGGRRSQILGCRQAARFSGRHGTAGTFQAQSICHGASMRRSFALATITTRVGIDLGG
jgi:hypothetical protein